MFLDAVEQVPEALHAAEELGREPDMLAEELNETRVAEAGVGLDPAYAAHSAGARELVDAIADRRMDRPGVAQFFDQVLLDGTELGRFIGRRAGIVEQAIRLGGIEIAERDVDVVEFMRGDGKEDAGGAGAKEDADHARRLRRIDVK